jgi:hypothetical protein
LFGERRNDPNPLCPVGRQVQSVLEKHVARFEWALAREMDKVTIADILAGVRSPSRR